MPGLLPEIVYSFRRWRHRSLSSWSAVCPRYSSCHYHPEGHRCRNPPGTRRRPSCTDRLRPRRSRSHNPAASRIDRVAHRVGCESRAAVETRSGVSAHGKQRISLEQGRTRRRHHHPDQKPICTPFHPKHPPSRKYVCLPEINLVLGQYLAGWPTRQRPSIGPASVPATRRPTAPSSRCGVVKPRPEAQFPPPHTIFSASGPALDTDAGRRGFLGTQVLNFNSLRSTARSQGDELRSKTAIQRLVSRVQGIVHPGRVLGFSVSVTRIAALQAPNAGVLARPTAASRATPRARLHAC